MKKQKINDHRKKQINVRNFHYTSFHIYLFQTFYFFQALERGPTIEDRIKCKKLIMNMIFMISLYSFIIIN